MLGVVHSIHTNSFSFTYPIDFLNIYLCFYSANIYFKTPFNSRQYEFKHILAHSYLPIPYKLILFFIVYLFTKNKNT